MATLRATLRFPPAHNVVLEHHNNDPKMDIDPPEAASPSAGIELPAPAEGGAEPAKPDYFWFAYVTEQ